MPRAQSFPPLPEADAGEAAADKASDVGLRYRRIQAVFLTV
jgi:hypothetical protein